MDNFAIIDSPGDTENDEYLEFFASNGYLYSKILIYLISEESTLDADSLRNNDKLEILIKIRLKYKIPILFLLSHADTYCDKVKKDNNDDWESICEEHINDNKKNFLTYINELIVKLSEPNTNLKLDENDILHIVLVEPLKITDEGIVKKLSKKLKQKYDKANEEKKKEILENFIDEQNEVFDYFEEKKELNLMNKKKLIEKLKENLPSQYHNAFNSN